VKDESTAESERLMKGSSSLVMTVPTSLSATLYRRVLVSDAIDATSKLSKLKGWGLGILVTGTCKEIRD